MTRRTPGGQGTLFTRATGYAAGGLAILAGAWLEPQLESMLAALFGLADGSVFVKLLSIVLIVVVALGLVVATAIAVRLVTGKSP